MTADILQFYSSRKKSIACPDAQQQKNCQRRKVQKIEVKQFCQLLNHCGMAGMGGMGGTASMPQGFLFFMHGHRAFYFSCTKTGLSIFHARQQGFPIFPGLPPTEIYIFHAQPQGFTFFMHDNRVS